MNVINNKILKFKSLNDKNSNFNKKELAIILKLYGKMVARGEWRDYGISMDKEVSVFSIYRHSAEYPIYRVKKTLKKSNNKNIFSVITMDGTILNSSSDLLSVLKPLSLNLIKRIK